METHRARTHSGDLPRPLRKEIAGNNEAAGELPGTSLSDDVDAFIATLKEKYADRVQHRPQAFKNRLLTLIAARLPPYPKPAGRPRQSRVSHAAEMYREQLAEMAKGNRQEVNWLPVARVCIPHFQRLNSYRRKDAIRTLRNSVYARLHRKEAKKHPRRLSAPIIPPLNSPTDFNLIIGLYEGDDPE